MRRTEHHRISAVSFPVAFVTALMLAGAAGADTCAVPSPAYPSIQSAVDAPSCSQIDVAAGTYPEQVVIGRSLELAGAGSTESFVLGGVEVGAGTVMVTGLSLSGPGEALRAHSGAEVSGFDLEVVSGALDPPLFADGFEDGTTGAWDGVSS